MSLQDGPLWPSIKHKLSVVDVFPSLKVKLPGCRYGAFTGLNCCDKRRVPETNPHLWGGLLWHVDLPHLGFPRGCLLQEKRQPLTSPGFSELHSFLPWLSLPPHWIQLPVLVTQYKQDITNPPGTGELELHQCLRSQQSRGGQYYDIYCQYRSGQRFFLYYNPIVLNRFSKY